MIPERKGQLEQRRKRRDLMPALGREQYRRRNVVERVPGYIPPYIDIFADPEGILRAEIPGLGDNRSLSRQYRVVLPGRSSASEISELATSPRCRLAS